MKTYVSARGLATALTALVAVQLALLTLSTVAWAAATFDLGTLSSAAALGGASILATLDGLAFVAAIVVFLIWVHHSIANLPALGSQSCLFTPAGAVWGFFIPFVNLVRGHQVMATIWQESQPPAANENGFYLPRKVTLVSWWWGLYLGSSIAGRLVPSYFADSRFDSAVAQLQTLATTYVVLHSSFIVTGVLFLVMIRGAQARQDEQWQDLERRRNVPQPTADALR